MADGYTDVLILGGGFGGVYSAMNLERGLRRSERDKLRITIVSRENYIVFQPLLPEVISGTIEILHVISPIRRLAPSAYLYNREIEEINLKEKWVRLAPGFRPKPLTLKYDHLVIGLGTQLDYSKVAGSREHAIPFKYLGDALRLRNHVVHVMEEADNELDPDEKRKLLTFVVAGGGFSGVECIAELNDFVRDARKAYRHIREDDIRVVLLQSADRILPEMSEDLAKFAHQILERRGVEIRLNTRLNALTANEAIISAKGVEGTETIPTKTTVATVPAGPHPLIQSLPCEFDRGRIKVNDCLQVIGWPGVWAVGDCAAVPQKDGITSPPTAQHALRQAKTCATNILASIRNQPLKPFTFTGLGKLGSLGRRSAVAEVFGLKMSGLPAWLLWRIIYLSKMPGLDRKIRVFADWFHDIFLPREITQVRIFTPDAVLQEHFEPGEYVFYLGDFGDKVYFIVNGEVEVVKDNQVLATLSKGDCFGEFALISDHPRSASIRAKTPLDVITVSRGAFKTLLTHVPGVKKSMEDVMSRYLGRQVDLHTEIPE